LKVHGKGKSDGERDEGRSDAWWASLVGQLLHPAQVASIEAFSHIGLPLCIADLVEILGEVEAVHLDHHLGRLRKLGALEFADSCYAPKDFTEMHYRLTPKGILDERHRDPLAVHLAGTIRKHRERFGISQEELARRTSLSRTEIGMIERGLRKPRLGTIVKLADALKVPAEAVFAGMRWDVEERAFVIEEGGDERVA
jgi:HTH-type transcriptional regulator, competence development regulator